MPQGKGTYGNKRGRPPMKDKKKKLTEKQRRYFGALSNK